MPTTTTAVDEIRKLEEGLVQAALNPDPEFFRKYVDDDMVMVTGEKHCCKPKSFMIEAHTPPGKEGYRFTRIEMSDMEFVAHDDSCVVVTCKGEYERSEDTLHLRFMRVWMKKATGWRIVSGVTY